MVNDVEKRWNDPSMLRHAVIYVVSVLVTAGVVTAAVLIWAAARGRCLNADGILCDTTARLAVGLGPGLVLLGGGLGALVLALRAWRAGRAWPIWQGAGWILLTIMVIYLSVASTQG